MKSRALRAFFTLVLAGPALAGRIDVPLQGELSPGAKPGVAGASFNPVSLQLAVPSLTAAALNPALTPAALAPAPVPAVQAEPLLVKAKALAPVLPATEPRAARKGAPQDDVMAGYGEGRARFDRAEGALSDDVSAPSAGEGAARESFLSRGARVEGAPKRPVPPAGRDIKIKPWEAADLGAIAAGLQLLGGIVFLIAGAHAAYPALAGALWALGGSGLIKHLASLRSVVVGGWQASHDQKMRVDYATGRLKDIRGRKYGSDRHDILAPGRVSAGERSLLDGASVALGLPWVFGGGPAAVVLYLLSAASTLYLRRAWRRKFPQPEGATAEDAVFERER